MLEIDRQIISAIRSCDTKEGLHVHLQNAVELEHATIPPYLTAMYSLVPGANEEIAAVLRDIVLEEMLHMNLSANVLIAIGGSPQINDPRFVPGYPGNLPMGIGKNLSVPIKAFSKDLVRDVFMKIEEPEHPIPVATLEAVLGPQYATIGEFYAAIKGKLRDLGDGAFVAGAGRQVLSWFGGDRVFPIVDVRSAERAIDIIVVEGEGTRTDPFESPGRPAHYYRFGEIYHGRKIVKDGDGFAYAGEAIPFDEAGVYPMIDNPSATDFPPGSQAAMLSDWSFALRPAGAAGSVAVGDAAAAASQLPASSQTI